MSKEEEMKDKKAVVDDKEAVVEEKMKDDEIAVDDDDDEIVAAELGGVTRGELDVAVRVLQAVGALHDKKRKRTNDALEVYQKPVLRPLRKALAKCLELHKLVMFRGKSEEDHYRQRVAQRTLKRQKQAEASQQKKYIAETGLRMGRIQKLQKHMEEAKEEEELRLLSMMPPDGHVQTTENTTKILLLEQEQQQQNDSTASTAKVLPKLRSCYVCKNRFRELHHFYDCLCPTCAELNWTKRHQTADLSGKVAVVTGARVKIGFQTCLKLLRAGAFVVATTRFPNAAAESYRKQDDFLDWKDRLQIYGLDLRDVTGLEAFTRYLHTRFHATGIDVIINNACQTIRRPRGYYTPLMEKERTIWEKSKGDHRNLLRGCAEFENMRQRIQQQDGTNALLLLKHDDDDDDDAPAFEKTGLSRSAAMSQMILLPEDVGVSDDAVLPPGVTDTNGQQLDLRKKNSWLLKMQEVSTPEVMECMFVNAIAPFVLNARLQSLMTGGPDRFVINVSAMEGKFYRYKMPNHPHTNMAKAALNMMTRTASEELAKKHGIYMNAVDTGWINDENPVERAHKTARANHFQTPIDEMDAAARILDPIFVAIRTNHKHKIYGKFLKDYRETEW